jgi:hypothetical protein
LQYCAAESAGWLPNGSLFDGVRQAAWALSRFARTKWHWLWHWRLLSDVALSVAGVGRGVGSRCQWRSTMWRQWLSDVGCDVAWLCRSVGCDVGCGGVGCGIGCGIGSRCNHTPVVLPWSSSRHPQCLVTLDLVLQFLASPYYTPTSTGCWSSRHRGQETGQLNTINGGSRCH